MNHIYFYYKLSNLKLIYFEKIQYYIYNLFENILKSTDIYILIKYIYILNIIEFSSALKTKITITITMFMKRINFIQRPTP